MAKPIVVVGSINLDLVAIGKRIPLPGETVVGGRFQTFNGGKGANQAVAVGRLGHAVRMIGKVGDDDFGGRLKRGLQANGIDVQGVTAAKGTASGVALISVDAQGQNSITVVPGANDALRPADLEKNMARLRSAGILLTQLETPMETVESLCQMAERLGIPLMLDPAPAPTRAIPRKMLQRVAWLTPNESETCALTGLSPEALSPATAAEIALELQGRGPANVVIKMGRHGAFVAGADGTRKMVPAFKVKAVDSTAAGDAFNGALAVALMRGLAQEDAVRFAAAAGALSTTRAGAQPSMPTSEEVDGFLRKQGARGRRASR